METVGAAIRFDNGSYMGCVHAIWYVNADKDDPSRLETMLDISTVQERIHRHMTNAFVKCVRWAILSILHWCVFPVANPVIHLACSCLTQRYEWHPLAAHHLVWKQTLNRTASRESHCILGSLPRYPIPLIWWKHQKGNQKTCHPGKAFLKIICPAMRTLTFGY